jgi:hypothetical protein
MKALLDNSARHATNRSLEVVMAMRVRSLITGFIIVGLMACGKQSEDHPEAPTLQTDRDSLGFGEEFGQGVWIGTSPQESLLVENLGMQTLHIDHVDKSGDPVFEVDLPEKLDVDPLGHTFIRVIFSPTEARKYSGALTIFSNDAQNPQKVINLSGTGIAPDSTDAGM